MHNKLLRLPEVIARTGLARSTIYLLISQGRFPTQIVIVNRAVGWIESEIDEWIDSKVVEARKDTCAEGGNNDIR